MLTRNAENDKFYMLNYLKNSIYGYRTKTDGSNRGG